MRWQISAVTVSVFAALAFAQSSQPNQPNEPSQPTQLSQPTEPSQLTQLTQPMQLNQPLLFLFRDDKAFHIGDIVTVLVTQTAVAAATAQTQTSKQVKVQTQAGTGVFEHIIPSAGIQHSGAFSTQAKESKNLSIITTIACRVMEINPVGLLRIEGSQEFTIDKRKQTVKLSGWVRPRDITPNNTVLSSQVADAKLELRGDWKTRKGKNLLERLIEGFNRILRILF